MCCCIKASHNCETIVTSSVPDPHHELLWLGIKLASGDELICGVCYHPPKPLYDVDTLINRISADREEIVTEKPGAVVCLVGDLNQLKTDTFEIE